MVPPPYRKSSDIISLILSEHKTFRGIDLITSKYKYIQLSRSLKSFGITFFNAKEKINGKMVPILIGVSKDQISRFDPNTRAILSTWNLKQIKNWKFNSNS